MAETDHRPSLVLGIDTSTRVSAGLSRDGEPLARVWAGTSRSHVELLAGTIEQLLDDHGVSLSDLTGVAVGMGPGPYTGLRVGVVAAEMLSLTLEIPVRHVCSLDVVAAGWAQTHPITHFVACSDARRQELYWAVYDEYGQRVDGPHVSAPAGLPRLPCVGPGTLLYPKAGGGMDSFLALKLGVRVDGIANEWPRPEEVDEILGVDAALLAAWADQLPEVGPEPLYLRHPDAEVPGAAKSVLTGREGKPEVDGVEVGTAG